MSENATQEQTAVETQTAPAKAKANKTKAVKPVKGKATTKPVKAKASANGERGMSMLQAAYTILKARTTPMNVKELIEAMASRKLWKSPGGATPHATLAAAMGTEIKNKGKDSRFKKVAPGQFVGVKGK